jgi:SNF2 family DNA or RNA helicase
VPAIHITDHAGKALIKPATFLGKEWSSYIDACRAAGASYDATLKAQLSTFELVPVVIEHLRRAGFEVYASKDLSQRLRDRAAAAQADVEKANDRVHAIDAELKKRGLELYVFQKEGVAWLAPRITALLGDDMGLGKTIQFLCAIPGGAPVIIICPASMKGIWRREMQKWRPDLKPIVLEGRGSFMWPRPGEAIIINREILPADPKNVQATLISEGKCSEGTVVITDEIHAFKGNRTEGTKRLRALTEVVLAAGGRHWGGTGTPILNRPDELWSLLTTLKLAADAFGSYPRFLKLFGGHKGGYGVEWSGETSPEIPALLKRVMLRRTKAEVLPDLPTKTWRDIEVEIDSETRQLGDEVLALVSGAGINVDEFNAATDDAVLSKMERAAFEKMSALRAALATAKIPALLEQLKEFDEQGEPVVVFSYHRKPVDLFKDKEGWAVITGDTSAEARAQIVDAFQGGRLKGVAATIQAAGVGLTLTRASQAIFVDLAWTPALNKQAEDRLLRIGQKRAVIITRLVADHQIDERVAELLAIKQRLIENTIEKAAGGPTSKPPVAQPVDVKEIDLAAAAPRPAHRGDFRGPKDDLEAWAAKGLMTLAALDADHARIQNGVGFSRMDNDFGHSLAKQIKATGKLSDKQWSYALKLANRYRGQIGGHPDIRQTQSQQTHQ